ncbi:hypothetical protein ACIP93_14420 [Streptomyces sp. NPDC088745]|uniref:hypothetical protein n=1 Tax=Streptomyces sp. NPDC088745 TaxID=3365884 RepID=UPI0038256127
MHVQNAQIPQQEIGFPLAVQNAEHRPDVFVVKGNGMRDVRPVVPVRLHHDVLASSSVCCVPSSAHHAFIADRGPPIAVRETEMRCVR